MRDSEGDNRADPGGSSENSSFVVKTEEEKGFLTMENSEERAGTKRNCRKSSEREKGLKSFANNVMR